MALLFVGAHVALAQVAEPPDTDQTRNGAFLGFSLTQSVGPKTDLFLVGAYRTGSFDFGLVNVGLRYNLNSNVTFGASYFGLLFGSSATSEDPFDDRLRFAAEIRRRFGKVILQHRSRFEYRSFTGGNGWRYRPEFRATWDIDVGKRSVCPFVAFEPFYDFDENDWTIVLGQVGVRIPVSENLSIEPAFMRARIFDGDDLNFYNLFLRYRF